MPDSESTNSEESEKRPQFGNRVLNDPTKVFEHNAWDNFTWNETMKEEAEKKVAQNSQTKVDSEKQEKLEQEADSFWNTFYGIHTNRFFKDRQWLHSEFPELFPHAESESETVSQEEYPGSGAHFRMLEVGCGVGNTLYPLVQANRDKSVYVYGCDFSSKAVDILKENPEYDESRCHAFVYDVTDTTSPLPFPEASLDVIVMIFVLSAIHPDKFACVINRLARYLKPGGRFVFRDYGQYDLAQMRFKNGQCLRENFYVRGDGTRVYFFTQEELRNLFMGAGLEEELNHADRRLLVNRGRQLQMHRVWLTCKYRRPEGCHKDGAGTTVVCTDSTECAD